MTELSTTNAAAGDVTDPRMREIDRFARFFDAQFRFPGTSMRFGWDSVLGLVPGLGDLVTLGTFGYLFHFTWKHGARKRTLARMIANSSVDFVFGSVPLLGDVFDVFFKANLRNAELLRREFGEASNTSSA